MTAVEYLEEKLKGDNIFSLDVIITKAKEMEKQQIIDAYADGRISVINREIISYEQYYNETFKKKEI